MFSSLVLAVLFLSSGSHTFTPGQQSQEPNPPSGQQQAAANTAEAEKPTTAKPRKIYTNDDLKGSGANDNFGSMPPGMDHINDCNSICFDQIRALSQVDTNGNPNWRRDALAAVDQVRNDGEWQRFLRDFYNAQYKLCMLGNDRNRELARTADPRNVTLQEIAVAEKYDVKQKEVQAELQALRSRQGTLQRKFITNRMAYGFTVLQTSWVASIYFYRVQYFVPR